MNIPVPERFERLRCHDCQLEVIFYGSGDEPLAAAHREAATHERHRPGHKCRPVDSPDVRSAWSNWKLPR